MSDLEINVKFVSWSPSRLDDYGACPRFAAHKHLLKTCPSCFKGTLLGFETPTCDTCGKARPMSAPMKRGGEIGKTLETYVSGVSAKFHAEVKHPIIVERLKAYRKEFKKGRVQVEKDLVFNDRWEPVSKFTKGAWMRTKLDLKYTPEPKKAKVIDWKTGGVDKETGKIKNTPESYRFQLITYAVATLCTFPEVEEVDTELAFVDTAPRFDPIVNLGVLKRAGVPREQKMILAAVKPMLRDEIFAPRCSNRCGWCDYGKRKGGPCPY